MKCFGWGMCLVALALAANGQRVAVALLQLDGTSVAALSAIISEHEMAEINSMQPQDQAERLVERAINHPRMKTCVAQALSEINPAGQ